MKLYHYITKGNSALTEGILSFAMNPDADLKSYYKRSGLKTHQQIVQWFENCFTGRSRGIRCFSEPIKWTENSPHLKEFIENKDMFSINIDALKRDGLLEAIYVSPSVLDTPELKYYHGCDEVLQKISGIEEIDYSPIDWSICDYKLGRRFAYVRYYLLIIKDGIISPEYITLEK